MASRPILEPSQVITNGSMASSITSAVTIITNLSMMSYSYTWSGTSPVGVITVQVSNDYRLGSDGSVLSLGTWNTIPLSDPASVSGNTGSGLIDIDQIGAYAIRTIYTPTSGSGTLQAFFKGKVA